MAVTAAYFRRWFGNLSATDNTLVTPADYSPYSIKLPADFGEGLLIKAGPHMADVDQITIVVDAQ